MKGYVVKEYLRWNQANEFRMNLSFPILYLLIERNENMLQNAPIWHWAEICIENMGYQKKRLNLFSLYWKQKPITTCLEALKRGREKNNHPT